MPKELSGSRDGEKRRSDQASEGSPASKKPRIDFATRPYQLHEQQQSQATIEEQLHILEEQSYIMHKQIQSIKEQYQAGSSNLMTHDFLTLLNQNQAHQTHLEIGNAIVDDFDDWFSQHHESCNQTKASSQSLPETRQPFDAHHPTEAQCEATSQQADVRQQDQSEQRQSTMVQRYETHDQAGPSDHAATASAQQRIWNTRQLHQQPEIISYEMPVAQQTGDFLAQPPEKGKAAEFLTKHEHNAYLSYSCKSQMNHRNQKKVEYNDKEVLAMRLYKTIYNMLNGHKSTDDIKHELDCRRQTEEYRKIFKDDQAGPSEQAKSEQERPWTNQQLSNFVIEVHTMFENEPNIKKNSELRNKLKSDDSKKIFYELHYNKKSFTDDDWNNIIKCTFKNIKVGYAYKRMTYKYLYRWTEQERNRRKAYDANRKQPRQQHPDDASQPL
jgi:hypothetical protein